VCRAWAEDLQRCCHSLEVALDDIQKGLPGGDGDEQARFIAATVIDGSFAVRVASLYLPNGNPAPGPKYDYKLAWMKRLQAFAQASMVHEEPLVLAGDYNVIPMKPAMPGTRRTGQDDALYLPADPRRVP
jgi:exodeoxyribonuclease-3